MFCAIGEQTKGMIFLANCSAFEAFDMLQVQPDASQPQSGIELGPIINHKSFLPLNHTPNCQHFPSQFMAHRTHTRAKSHPLTA